MKRGLFLGICTAVALILVLGVAWLLQGKLVPTSSPKPASTSGPATGIVTPSNGTEMAVNIKIDTSGDDPPIIFTRDGNIFAVRLDGVAPVPLTNTGYNVRPYYLPQENKLLFIRTKSDRNVTGDVMGIDFSAGWQTVLLPASRLERPEAGFVLAALSPVDGKLIVTEGDEHDGRHSLRSASPDGKDLSLSITGDIPAGRCAFNPEGSGLAFENKHTDVRATLIYNLFWNKTPVPLITSGDTEKDALWAEDYAWRPDDQSIAFFGYTDNTSEGPQNGIYLVTTGGQVTQICSLPNNWASGLHWLGPDRLAFISTPLDYGTSCAWGSSTGTMNFRVVSVPSGEPELLGFFHIQPDSGRSLIRWSWNPSRTAFVFQKEQRGSLWVKDLSTGEEKEIAGTEGSEPYDFTWGSDPFSSPH